MPSSGSLDILNTGAGHVSIQFDRASAVERERARRMIADCLRRGYAIFVEIDGELQPVRAFDAERGVYLITDVPTTLPAGVAGLELDEIDAGVPIRPPTVAEPPAMCPRRCGKARHRGRCARREVPMDKARATAVGRSAGG